MSCEHRVEVVGDGMEDFEFEEHGLTTIIDKDSFDPSALASMNDEQRPCCRIALDDGSQDPFCDRPEGTEEARDLARETVLVG